MLPLYRRRLKMWQNNWLGMLCRKSCLRAPGVDGAHLGLEQRVSGAAAAAAQALTVKSLIGRRRGLGSTGPKCCDEGRDECYVSPNAWAFFDGELTVFRAAA